jgi:hypothetical protein
VAGEHREGSTPRQTAISGRLLGMPVGACVIPAGRRVLPRPFD